MTGRPTLMNEEKVRQLDSLCAMRGSLIDCAEVMNVHPSTIEKWIRKNFDQTFSEYRNQKMAKTRFMVIRNLLELCKAKNLTALIYVSKNLCGWSDNPMPQIEEQDKNIQLSYSDPKDKK